jgi:hypothetical protein
MQVSSDVIGNFMNKEEIDYQKEIYLILKKIKCDLLWYAIWIVGMFINVLIALR